MTFAISAGTIGADGNSLFMMDNSKQIRNQIRRVSLEGTILLLLVLTLLFLAVGYY